MISRFPKKEIYYVEKLDDMVHTLYTFIKPGDMVITMGAGSIYKVGESLVNLIEEKGMPK